MARKIQPHEVIRERLEQLFDLGATLQEYVYNLRRSVPVDARTETVLEELIKLETRLNIVNEILYLEKNSLTIERSIERLRKNGNSQA